MGVIPSIYAGANLWVELSVQNIAFVKEALQSALREEPKEEADLAHATIHVDGGHVKWRPQRKAWLAVRGTKAGKGNAKSFRISDPTCDLQMREKQDEAKQWAEGQDATPIDNAAAPGDEGELLRPIQDVVASDGGHDDRPLASPAASSCQEGEDGSDRQLAAAEAVPRVLGGA